MIVISPEKKLKYLSKYITDRVDSWPKKIKPFDHWLESTLAKKANKIQSNIIEYNKKACRYCARQFEDNYLERTKDHIVPMSRGGLDKKENRVACCFDCNQWKSDKPLDKWLKELQTIIKKEKKIHLPYTKSMVGTMIGRIKVVLNNIQSNESKVSRYKL